MAPEDIKPGDVMICNVDYYQSYDRGDPASVLDVVLKGNKLLFVFANPLCDYGHSVYLPENWIFSHRPVRPKKEPAKMASYEKTKFFGALLKNQEGETFINIDNDRMTALRDSKTQAMNDVKENIADGERWVVLQTVALIEPVVQPKVPTKVTEYR